ncbi:nucleotidyl transferase AbiEii/AbiGii toxin family protein [Arcanobacterium hippocoleae]
MMYKNLNIQRKVSKILLKALSEHGFALAGSGAIREHNLITRATEDIDLFTIKQYENTFQQAVEIALKAIHSNSFAAQAKLNGSFARIVIEIDNTTTLTVDMGVDFRSQKPAVLEIGQVLSLEDAVGSKVAALYSRGEDRDFLDVDAIRQSEKFDDKELIHLAKNIDAGFDLKYFAARLKDAEKINIESVSKYSITKPQLDQIKHRYTVWCNQILEAMRQTPFIQKILAKLSLRKFEE